MGVPLRDERRSPFANSGMRQRETFRVISILMEHHANENSNDNSARFNYVSSRM